VINHRKLAVALVCGLAFWVLASPTVHADATHDLGLGGPGPHRTRLTTQEEGCTELQVNRASNLAAVRALVPERYSLYATPAGAGRIRVVNYFCEAISVDGQQRAKATLVSFGMAETTSRDGTASVGNYLLWYGTSDPVLAARMRQLGVPAQHLEGASVEPYVDGQPTWSLEVPAPLAHRLDVAAVVSPSPMELETPELGLTVFYDGPRGDLRFQWLNSAFSFGSGAVAGDLTGLEPLVPLIFSPNLLTLSGASRFGFYRGNWTMQAERLDS
jgi:hypothetical protein